MTPHDNNLKTVRYALIRKRNGISNERFRRYWGDVHGPICVELPGLAAYQQFHLGAQQPRLWHVGNDVSMAASADVQIQGIAECGFNEMHDYEAWVKGAVTLMDDERNVFSGTYGYYTLDGCSHTPRWASAWEIKGGVHFCVLLRKRAAAEPEPFKHLVCDILAPLFARSEEIFGVRHHVFAPYEVTKGAWHAGLIDHAITDANRYEAALEIVVSSQLALNHIFDGEAYQATLSAQSALLEAAHAYEIDNAPILVAQGKSTMAGRRGASVAAIIEELGATNVQ